jgi:hypothetical protein
MRDDRGKLYSLVGDLAGFQPGDRVLVTGIVAANDRICRQAETVQVVSIEEAPW